ncbi:MAG TPA: cyclic nucleotide-binding domain-containing protein [bacterium]|nr:cyclic nucleotide-binding domain-containing protein [bacterium]
MKIIDVATGVFWVEIPERNFYLLCGCPEDSVKLLMKKGLITNTEKNGVRFQTGPNAILLSDSPIQNGAFSNLSEFPVLHMFYFQGLIIPGHVNNTGVKPMLIGTQESVDAQSRYIYRGNYGLVSEEEIMETGIPAAKAKEMMRLKRRFAFDKILQTEELLDLKTIDNGPLELRDGIQIERKSLNLYKISFEGETIEIDLNLRRGQEYENTYQLDHHKIEKEYFSVVHLGEGDGWDVNRPQMSSMITFQGKYYLIDAGPNVLDMLAGIGVSINEIEGVFHTHAHDDHFAGLTSLARADHKLKYFSTPLVYASVTKKFAALSSMDESDFTNFFDVHYLELEKWNNVEGLEVKPVFSPHPVETTILFFRAMSENSYKSYAHFADTVAFKVLEKMVTDDDSKSGVTEEFYEGIKKSYLTPANLKKIDIGGGMIHGEAEDYAHDKSDKLILCHIPRKLTDRESEIGSNAFFGQQDVLIPSRLEYDRISAWNYLKNNFREIPDYELEMLANCGIESFNAGSILIKQGQNNDRMYIIVSGIVDFLISESGIRNKLSAGSIVGELSGLIKKPSMGTFRAASHVTALCVPSSIYIRFAKRNKIYEEIKETYDKRIMIKNTWLFGEMVSYTIHKKIARELVLKTYDKGNIDIQAENRGVFVIEKGSILIKSGNKLIANLGPGDFFGEDGIIINMPGFFTLEAASNVSGFFVPAELIKNIPIVMWKLMETFNQRLACWGRQHHL